MVYQVEGGWVADIVISGVPAGLPNVVGLPEKDALPTAAAAEEIGFELLVGLLAAAEWPTFQLFEVEAPLARSTFDEIRKSRTGPIKGYESLAAARERVAMVLRELLPEGVTLETFNSLPERERRRLLVVLHLAALTGLMSYP